MNKTKVIPFSGRHFKIKKYPPLTSKMIVALLAAIDKQNKEIPFGPDNIKGSLTSLISRGLIVQKEVIINKRKESHWQVTDEAISLLSTLGIKIVKIY